MDDGRMPVLTDLGVLAAVVLLYGAVSRRVEAVISAPLAFVVAGLALGPGALGVVELDVDDETILLIAEVALVLVLFYDASRIDATVLRENASLPARLLGIGMPLTIAAGTGAAAVLVADLELWEGAILATILAPTDAALGQAVASDPRVPVRVRQALNVESGLNDGLSVPLLFVFVALAGAEADVGTPGFWARFAAEQIGLGALCGVLVGLGGGWIVERATRTGWMGGTFTQLAVLALPVLAWAAAGAVEGNGFIAAFVAGLVTGRIYEDCGEQVANFTDDQGKLLELSVFLILGVVAAPMLGDVSWEVVLYALLSLTLIRGVPVALALAGTGLRRVSVLFIAWFGPRGLASIILAYVVLEEETELAGLDTIVLTMTVTVLLSVAAHGVTAAPLTARLGRRLEDMDEDAAEMRETMDLPTRRP
jgi:NhaP-type Na+/H+ or K+/H+ antiporter